MSDGPLRRVIRQTLLNLQAAGDLTDGQLLERFVRQRDEAAFEALVRRHGPMVLRVCRRILPVAQDAEDAFQATFLVLVRKAASVGRGELVGGWLHGVACRVAMKARAGRRRRNELPIQEEITPAVEGSADPGWQDLRPVLDQELGRLPEKYRTPMVLCYLEGKTNREAAEQLGWTRWTVATRLSRGRALLRNRLERRGLALSLGSLATLLAAEAAAARVPETAVVIVKLSTGGTAGLAVSGPAAGLAQSAINGIFWAKARVWVAAVAAIIVLGAGATIAMRSSLAPVVAADAEETVAAPVDDHPVRLGHNTSLGGRRPFPDDNPWNTEIADQPVDPNSATLIASIGPDKPLQARFGAPGKGIPYAVVSGKQPRVPMQFNYVLDTDRGPYPVPPDARREAGPIGSAQMIVLDRDNWKLYEMLSPVRSGSGWRASYGAVFDLNSNQLRPYLAPSADGAGLPIFPGLVRGDEVFDRKEIRHALRFSVKKTRRAFVEPARHYASSSRDPKLPPMGMRVRLRADYDIREFPPSARVILTALKRYGMFLATHGEDWGLSGSPDPRWNEQDLATLQRVTGKDLEVVKMGRIESREMPPR